MKVSLAFVLMNFFILHCYSLSSDKMQEADKTLQRLDSFLVIRDFYQKQKDERINILQNKLKDKKLSLSENYSYSHLLFEEYSTFQYKLMYMYAQRLVSLAKQMNDKNKIVDSEICVAYSHLWGGAFKDSYEYINSVDTVDTSKDTQADYLLCLLNLEYESGLYVKPLHYLTDNYKQKMFEIVNKMEAILSACDDRLLEAKQKAYYLSNDFDRSYQFLSERLKGAEGVSRSVSSRLGDYGFLNLEKGDTLTAFIYMSRAAIIDIKLGSRQIPALRKLSETTYACGSLERSYQYIQLAMNNAVFFDSRYRMYESSSALLDIDRDLYELTKDQKDKLNIVISLIIAFLLALLVSFFIIWKQKKKLMVSQRIIEERNKSLLTSNERIKDINRALFEANCIKDAYLGKILMMNSSSIVKIENLAQIVIRKIRAKQYDDIISFINKNNYVKVRTEMLEHFDRMFLKLFPDFIEKFNTLFEEKDQVIIQDEFTLTPELRIFALTRLGITKSDIIAEILDYSSSTVRNYKTKMRNISIVDNKDFDRKIMEIGPETED